MLVADLKNLSLTLSSSDTSVLTTEKGILQLATTLNRTAWDSAKIISGKCSAIFLHKNR